MQRKHFLVKLKLSLQREKEKVITLVSSSSSPAERLQWTVLAEHRGAFLAPEERDRESPPDRAAAACTEHTRRAQ